MPLPYRRAEQRAEAFLRRLDAERQAIWNEGAAASRARREAPGGAPRNEEPRPPLAGLVRHLQVSAYMEREAARVARHWLDRVGPARLRDGLARYEEDEQRHADWFARRAEELGGDPWAYAAQPAPYHEALWEFHRRLGHPLVYFASVQCGHEVWFPRACAGMIRRTAGLDPETAALYRRIAPEEEPHLRLGRLAVQAYAAAGAEEEWFEAGWEAFRRACRAFLLLERLDPGSPSGGEIAGETRIEGGERP